MLDDKLSIVIFSDKKFAREENGRDAFINLVSDRYNSILPLQEKSKTAELE